MNASVSVCICTYSRALLLERALEALKGARLGAETGFSDFTVTETIVVDNEPDSRVRDLCARMSRDYPVRLRYVEEKRRGISFARNRAAKEALARGADFVSFIDDDDVPEPDWLVRLHQRQIETGADIVFGSWRFAAAQGPVMGIGGTPLFDKPPTKIFNNSGQPTGGATCNVLIGRRILRLLEAQGEIFAREFALTGSEDSDFFIRAGGAGAVFARTAESIINKHYEARRLTTSGILLRAFRYGCTSIAILKKHGTVEQVKRKKKKALKRLRRGLAALPLYLTDRRAFLSGLAEICRGLGTLYGCFGGRYRYYR